MTGIILSIIFPGLGQFYHGDYWKGAIMMLFGITPLYPMSLVWSIADSVKKAREKGPLDKTQVKWLFVSVFILAPLFIVMILIGTRTIVKSVYNNKLYPKYTREELLLIKTELEIYKNKHKRYPENFYVLFEGRPLQKTDWQLDAWDNPYKIIWEDDNVRMISAGKDGIFDTEDDIKIE